MFSLARANPFPFSDRSKCQIRSQEHMLGMLSLKRSTKLLYSTSDAKLDCAKCDFGLGVKLRHQDGAGCGPGTRRQGEKGRVSGTTCSWVERMPVGSSLRQAGLSQVATMQHTMKC